jgi:hypothetical protein
VFVYACLCHGVCVCMNACVAVCVYACMLAGVEMVCVFVSK